MKRGSNDAIVNLDRHIRDRTLRVQTSLLLTLPACLAELRGRLDPRMAGRVPPHVTVVYDDEAPDAGLLLDRLREAYADLGPVELRLGGVDAVGAPDVGLYVAAEAGPSFALLRARVLRAPFAPRGPAVRPHLTLLHPSSVADPPARWQAHAGTSIQFAATVREVTVIQSDGGDWSVRALIPLGGL